LENNGKGLKTCTWIFIILSVITPLFAIGSIICSIKYKKYDQAKGANLLKISIIVGVVIFILNLFTLLGLG